MHPHFRKIMNSFAHNIFFEINSFPNDTNTTTSQTFHSILLSVYLNEMRFRDLYIFDLYIFEIYISEMGFLYKFPLYIRLLTSNGTAYMSEWDILLGSSLILINTTSIYRMEVTPVFHPQMRLALRQFLNLYVNTVLELKER